jgi:KUP system potassium uptake protein
VYGDIGTSPLYTIKESFSRHATHAVAVNETNVLGVLSLFRARALSPAGPATSR